MGTNWFMPALVKSKLGASGRSGLDGTTVCCFSLKKSRKEARISEEVMKGITKLPNFTKLTKLLTQKLQWLIACIKPMAKMNFTIMYKTTNARKAPITQKHPRGPSGGFSGVIS